MDVSDQQNGLRETLKALKDDGVTVMSMDGLLYLLDSSTPPQEWLAELRRWQAQSDATTQRGMELFRSIMNAAHAAFKSATLINGGAAVAVLTFVSSLAQHKTPIQGFGWVVGLFASGALVSAMAAGGTYLAQRRYARAPNAATNPWTTATIGCVIASYGFFAIGCGVAMALFSGGHFQSAQ